MVDICNDPQLQARGIASAAAAMHWATRGDYWRYPVHDLSGVNIGYRLKLRAPDATRPKYLWEGGKPANPATDFYHAPDIAEAIAAASGVVYLANGEPSVLAYHAAGIRNVFATTHTENKVPDGTLAMLRQLGVTRLVYAPDADDTGIKSAVKFREYLAGSGIDFEALDLNACVAAKGDFNDLWIASHFNAENARNALQRLPALSLPAPVEKPTPRQAAPITDKASLIAAIGSALNLDPAAVKATGFSRKNFKCLWHDDKQASAGFNWHTGAVYCFVCGMIQRDDVAARVNIDVSRYQTQPAPKVRSKNEAQKSALLHIPPNRISNQYQYISFDKPAPPASWWVTADIPHSHHAALLLTCDVGATRLVLAMHAAFLAGKLNGQNFTVGELAAISPIERSAIYRAIEKMQNLGLVALLGIEGIEETTTPKYATSYRICDPSGLKWTLFQRGIHPALFRRYFATALPPSLPPAMLGDDDLPDDATLTPAVLRQLAVAFDGLASETDRATQSKYKSELKIWHAWLNDPQPLCFEVAPDADKTDYRAAILRAVLANTDPDERHARRDLARMCGCSENTLDKLYAALELMPVPQWEPVALAPGNREGIQAQYVAAQKANQGRVINVIIGNSTTSPTDFDSIQAAQARGEIVIAQLRVASQLRPMTDIERQRAAATRNAAPAENTADESDEATEAKPVITLFERWLFMALNRMGYSLNQHRDIIARNGDPAAYEVGTDGLIDFILKARRLEQSA